MYLKTIKARDKYYLYLMDSYRDHQSNKIKEKIIQRFGRLDLIDPNVYEELLKKYHQGSLSCSTVLREQHKNTLDGLIQSLNENNDFSTAFNQAPILNYGHLPLKQLWDNLLNLDYKINYLQKSKTDITSYKLNNIAFAMVANKLIEPGSYLQIFESQSTNICNPLNGICLDNIYAALDYLNSFKDDIIEHAVRNYRKAFNLSAPKLVFFDCTNFYCETPYDDKEHFIHNFVRATVSELNENLYSETAVLEYLKSEEFSFKLDEALKENEDSFLRMRGPSKEGRFSLPLVTLSLVIDENGVPIDFEVFAGNTSEFKTVKPCIEKLKKKYGITQAYFVSDKGLNSADNLNKILSEDFGFIVSQKISNFSDSVKADMFDSNGWMTYTTASDNHFIYSFVSENHEPSFKYKVSNFIKKAVVTDETTRNKRVVNIDCKIMYSFSKLRQKYDLHSIEEQIAKAEKAVSKGLFMGNPYGNGWRSLVITQKEKTDNKKDKEMYRAVGINHDAVDKMKALAGYAAVIYHDPKNSPETIDDKTVIDSYKSLVKIEECFRVMKHNFSIRPMYVRVDTHIKAHCLICTLALILLRILQIKLNQNETPMSSMKIMQALKNAQLLMIGSEDVFVNIGKYEDIYTKDRCKSGKYKSKINDVMDIESIVENYIEYRKNKRSSALDNILTACKLTPLNQLSNMNEIKKRLKIRNSIKHIADPSILAIAKECFST